MGGINDLWYGMTWKEVLPNVFSMVRQAQYLNIQPVIGIPPLFVNPDKNRKDPFELYPPEGGYICLADKVMSYREKLIQLCIAEGVPYADIFSVVLKDDNVVDPKFYMEDGLHFNEEGCEKVSACVCYTFKNK